METTRPVDLGCSSLIRVVRIPELAERILDLLDNCDLASLASLSRVLFESVIPIVWKEVNTKPLITLIPGVKIVDDEANSAYDYILSVPENPDLSRFRVYSPHVKHLRGTPKYTVQFSIEDNSSFELGLLPNLQHITLVSQRHYDHNDLGTLFAPINLEWVRHFLCPSLVSLRMFGVDVEQPVGDESNEHLPWMNRTACLRLVAEMSDRCPGVETIQMFPDDSGEGFCEDSYYNLAGMSNLGSFTWSGHRVSQGLMSALGELPCLESLYFMSNIAETPYPSPENPYNPDADTASNPIVLPGGSFPALNSLKLHNLGPQTIAKLCRLSLLFQGLTHLMVSYASYSSPYWCNTSFGRDWSHDVFTCLGHGSPHLKDLEIGNTPGPLALIKATGQLRQMPLRRLSLSSAWIPNDEVGCWQFAEALPNVEELEVWLELRCMWLPMFASRLPKLRYLRVNRLDFLNMEKMEESANREGQSGPYDQEITIRANFRLRYPMVNTAKEAGRYIYGIWPNARFETHSATSDSMEQKAKRLLNARLEALRSGQN